MEALILAIGAKTCCIGAAGCGGGLDCSRILYPTDHEALHP